MSGTGRAYHRPKPVGSEFRRNTQNRKCDVTSTISKSQVKSEMQSAGSKSDTNVLISERVFSVSFQFVSGSILQDLKCKSRYIQHVRLHGNGLLFLPNAVYQIIGLKELEVSWNRLSSLNASIGNLISLERLDLSFNSIVYIPSELSKCTSLTYLNVSDNKIKRIPAALRFCRSLQDLHLEYNMLMTIPNFLETMPSLQNLKHHGNLCSSDFVVDNMSTKHINGVNTVDSHETDLDCVRRLLADFNPNLLALFDHQSAF
jgi:Leucine-rich repeat (LRR) protein